MPTQLTGDPVMPLSSRRPMRVGRRAWAVVIATALVTGCGVASHAAIEVGADATSSPSMSGAASADPTPATRASGPPSAPPGTSTAAGRPPDAALSADGGDAVIGSLGSYAWGDGGSDAPWLPGAPIRVGAGEPLRVTIKGTPSIASWTFRMADADAVGDADARLLAEGSADVPVVIAAPSPGAWTLQLAIRFAAGGSATYSWRLDVP